MNSQFVAGQPPPNYLQPNPSAALPQGVPNNGTDRNLPHMPPQPSAFAPPNIAQKMQSMNLGAPSQQQNGQFNQSQTNQYQKLPSPNFPGQPGAMMNSSPIGKPFNSNNNESFGSHPSMPPQGMPPQGMPPQNMPPQRPNINANIPPSGFNQRLPASMNSQQMPPVSHQETGSFQGMTPMSNIGLPPMSSAPGLPPMSSTPGLPPMSNTTGLPPMSSVSGLPPMSNTPGMPPMSNASGLPPMSNASSPPGGPGLPPLSGGPGLASMSGIQGLQPMSNAPGLPSMSSGPGMPPMSGLSTSQPGNYGPPRPGDPQNSPPFANPMMNKFPGQNIPPPMGQPPGFNQNFQNQQPKPPMGTMPHPGMQPQPMSPMQGNMPGYPNQQAAYPPGSMPGQQIGYANQQSGYPNQPGFANQQMPYPGQQPSQPPGYPAQNQYGYQQQAPKKLNPDQMPSPIQVMIEDQNANGGVFATNGKGRVPPLVTTNFQVMDQGNASPRYIRSSMYSVPSTPDMMKQTAVPFCVVLSPLAEVVDDEQEPPLLDFSILTGVSGNGPVRCSRCKAYMCPAMKFVDAGRHFQCAFCKATTEVPMEYTQYLNNGQHYGQNTPEMSLGCYEIVATKEYCRNNVLPSPPALIFVIDVSYNAIKSGMVDLLIGRLRSLLESPKIKKKTRIGIITYSSTIHFYNINENLGQPQMMVVGDIHDVFVPLARGLLAEPSQVGHLLDALAQQIPTMFKETKETETMLLPAVQAGLEALKAAECCGKLLIFHSALPTAQAPGQLLNRDDRKLLGTEKEKNILNPQTKVYNEVAQECVSNGCGIDLFLFNNSYADVATVGQLSRLTGGSVHKYTYFQANVDGGRFIQDLTHVLSRPTAYDAVMRVRTSTGVRATDFYGHFFMSNTTDIELATLDCDKAIAVEIKHDDKLTAEDGVYIQVALLYTHASGERRLRICNLALGIATQMADLYRSCDLDTVINFLAKQAVWRLSEHTPKSLKEGIIARCAQSLACYRKHCASPSSVGQLVLPESMKLLPLYANCLLKSDAISGGSDISCDDRSWAMQAALYADVSTSLVMFYPSLYRLNPLVEGMVPESLRCTVDKLQDDSIFLLDNSIHMMMWIGLQTPQDLIRDLFGVNTIAEINTEELELPVLSTPFNEEVRKFIECIRIKRKRCMRLTMIRQHDKLEMIFRHFLVEDEGRNGASSYMDFLCHLHKEIRALL